MSVERRVRVFALFGAMAVAGTWLLVAQDASRVGGGVGGDARPVPVAPMDSGGSALVPQRCPGFSWSAVPEASGYELVVYRAETSALDSTAPVIRVRLPRGSSWWSPSADQCLDAGTEYAWLVRALGGSDPRWSEPTLFRIDGSSPDELAAALELVAAHLGVTVGSVATSEGRAIGRVQPGESSGEEFSPVVGASIVVTRTAAIDAGLPDTSGPALGVIGTTHSPDGAGVGGNSTAAGGVGGYFTNSGGGDLLAASGSGIPSDRMFRVDNGGNVVAPSFSGDGTGVTGVDADLLDGTDSTGFFVLSEDETVVGTPTFTTNFKVGSTTLIPDLNADLLDGLSSSEFAQSAHDHAGKSWSGGSSSGLNLSGNPYGLSGAGVEAGVYGYNGGSLGAGVEGLGVGGIGVLGQSLSGTGVVGEGGSGTGDYGGYFTGYSGVYGSADSASGVGVRAESENTSLTGGALSAVNTTTSTGVAIYAEATNGTDNSAYGVWGTADFLGVIGTANKSDGTHYGVYGSASDGGYGVFSAGDMFVSGTLAKSAGSFKIDHPLDPENKYLYHSFVESPDMMNVYNGNVVLDAKGSAWVELPGYFEALNMEFRYQLTAIGTPAPGLHVATEIVDNRFQVAGGEPDSKVSWQVTGIRNDPYARDNRIPVVEEKSDTERGTFLHPEPYGQPIESGFDYRFGPVPVTRATGASTE